jgi:hypothetical protein
VLEDVVAAHAPNRLNSKTTARLIAVCLSILFFMGEGTPPPRLLAMTRFGYLLVPRSGDLFLGSFL